jgi:hypothetical protein
MKKRIVVLGTIVVLLITGMPGWVWAQAQLENPRPGSFQSGIGVINGWVCEAEEVIIEINGTPVRAAYGTTRRDTQMPNGPCADDLTGFGLTVNWNLFGDGVQMVRALADGVEFGRAAVTVTTLGLGEFPQGLSRRVQVANFPQAGANTEVQWQESQQNFVIGSGSPSGGGNSGTAGIQALLEDPRPGSFQSGIGVIRGWVCEASTVTIEIDGTPIEAAYGTTRRDTQMPLGPCAGENTGFGLTFNWNLVGAGLHRVRALADGVEFANVTFTVTTLGLGEFVRNLAGSAIVSNFPQAETGMRLQWQESQQNFPLAGARPPGVPANQCIAQQGEAVDGVGGNATMTWTNPCLLTAGQTLLMSLQPMQSGAQTATLRSQSTDGAFFACAENLSFLQGDRVFRSSDFRWIDSRGNPICRMVSMGEILDTLVQLNDGVALDFNAPFSALYTNQPVVEFPPVTPPSCVGVSPTQLNFGIVLVGESSTANFTVTNIGQDMLNGTVTLGPAPEYHIVSGGTLMLNPGASQQVVIEFRPADMTTVNSSATVNSNCGSALVALLGTGTTPPRLAVFPEQIDFGEVKIGETVPASLTVTNAGGGNLTGELVFCITGGSCGPTTPFNLGSEESQPFNIIFSAPQGTRLGPFTGSVDITSNAGNASVPVSGTVVP